MNSSLKFKLGLCIFLALIPFVSIATAARWGTYHWGRTQNPFSLTIGKNYTKAWDSPVTLAAHNWSKTKNFDMYITFGQSNPAQCSIKPARIEVCNYKYGNTGWFGYTQLTTIGDVITGANVKLNDSYRQNFEHRNMIACHEIGHALGLWHQDEAFGNPNLGTCLDYTTNPITNQQPNSVDYAELDNIYSSLDPFDSFLIAWLGTGVEGMNLSSASNWGTVVKHNKDKHITFEKDLGYGRKLITEVTLVPGETFKP